MGFDELLHAYIGGACIAGMARSHKVRSHIIYAQRVVARIERSDTLIAFLGFALLNYRLRADGVHREQSCPRRTVGAGHAREGGGMGGTGPDGSPVDAGDQIAGMDLGVPARSHNSRCC